MMPSRRLARPVLVSRSVLMLASGGIVALKGDPQQAVNS